jgi:hypothetical protein
MRSGSTLAVLAKAGATKIARRSAAARNDACMHISRMLQRVGERSYPATERVGYSTPRRRPLSIYGTAHSSDSGLSSLHRETEAVVRKASRIWGPWQAIIALETLNVGGATSSGIVMSGHALRPVLFGQGGLGGIVHSMRFAVRTRFHESSEDCMHTSPKPRVVARAPHQTGFQGKTVVA